MSGFDLSTTIWLSIIHFPSYRLSKFGQIGQETIQGSLAFTKTTVCFFDSLILMTLYIYCTNWVSQDIRLRTPC